MSAPNSPEQRSEGGDINTFLEKATAPAELVLDETSDELNLNENGQELTSLEFPDLEFIENNRYTIVTTIS